MLMTIDPLPNDKWGNDNAGVLSTNQQHNRATRKIENET